MKIAVHCLLADLGCTRHSPSKLDSAMRAVSAKERKSWGKWQPAFRLVKVVFVVVNRQHRVHNQTVVPVVSVVVKTKAQKIIDKSERLVETRYCLTG